MSGPGAEFDEDLVILEESSTNLALVPPSTNRALDPPSTNLALVPRMALPNCPNLAPISSKLAGNPRIE
jgi:hypothetical protein